MEISKDKDLFNDPVEAKVKNVLVHGCMLVDPEGSGVQAKSLRRNFESGATVEEIVTQQLSRFDLKKPTDENHLTRRLMDEWEKGSPRGKRLLVTPLSLKEAMESIQSENIDAKARTSMARDPLRSSQINRVASLLKTYEDEYTDADQESPAWGKESDTDEFQDDNDIAAALTAQLEEQRRLSKSLGSPTELRGHNVRTRSDLAIRMRVEGVKRMQQTGRGEEFDPEYADSFKEVLRATKEAYKIRTNATGTQYRQLRTLMESGDPLPADGLVVKVNRRARKFEGRIDEIADKYPRILDVVHETLVEQDTVRPIRFSKSG